MKRAHKCTTLSISCYPPFTDEFYLTNTSLNKWLACSFATRHEAGDTTSPSISPAF